MKVPFVFCCLAAACLLASDAGLRAQPAAAPPRATLPYRLLYDLTRPFPEPQPFQTIEMRVRFVEAKSEEPIEGLVAVIHSSQGKQPAVIRKDGSIKVPLSEELYEEDPPVVTNQPRGSLQLRVGLFAPFDPEAPGKLRYARLAVLADAYSRYMRTVSAFFNKPPVPMTVFTIAPNNVKEPFIVHSVHGDRVYSAGPDGTAQIPFDVALLREDPPITAPPSGWRVVDAE